MKRLECLKPAKSPKPPRQKRPRRLTAAQKKILSAAGLDATRYLYVGENELYLFLVNKYTGDHDTAPKGRK